MKIIVNNGNKPKQIEQKKETALVVIQPVRRNSFWIKFIRVCREDIERKLSKFLPEKKWSGVVPKIEPRYK